VRITKLGLMWTGIGTGTGMSVVMGPVGCCGLVETLQSLGLINDCSLGYLTSLNMYFDSIVHSK
jgi:hypothetical protein